MASPSSHPTFRTILALIKSPSLSTCDFIPQGAIGALWLACTDPHSAFDLGGPRQRYALPISRRSARPLSHRLVPPNVNEQLLIG